MLQSILVKIPITFLIVAFLLFDFSLLFINTHLATKLANDALLINVVGRQRMLSQQIAKNVLALQQGNNEAESQLRKSTQIFEQTLRSLLHGGKIQSPGGANIHIQKLADTESRAIIREASKIWNLVYPDVLGVPSPLKITIALENYASSGQEQFCLL